MAKINEGFFVMNDQQFKEKEENRWETLSKEQYNRAKSVKYIISDKHIMVDADSTEAYNKIVKLNEALNIHPYAYKTKDGEVIHGHFWYEVDEKARDIIDTLKYNSKSKHLALDMKIDTRAYNTLSEATGAVFLKQPGKEQGNRPYPTQLLEELDKKQPVVPYLLLLPTLMEMVPADGDGWDKYILPFCGRAKFAKWDFNFANDIIREAALYHGNTHDEQTMKHNWDRAKPIPWKTGKVNKHELEYLIQRPIDKKTNEKKYHMPGNGFFNWDDASELILKNFDLVMYKGKIPMTNVEGKWKRLDVMPIQEITRYISNEKLNIVPRIIKKMAEHTVNFINDVHPKLNRNYIYLKNGYYDYTTGKFTKEENPEYNHRRLDVNYVEQKKGSEAATKLETFLKSYMTKDNPMIFKQICEMWAGILVPTEISRKIFHLFGNGYNGKSELMKFTNAFIGTERTSTLDLKLLTSSKATDRLQMVDKMLNYIDELENKSKNSGIGQLKALSAGGPITAEVKYGPSFTFSNEATIVIGANDILKMTERSNALEDRLHPIFFTKRFKDENGNRIDTGFDPSTIRHDEKVHEAAVYSACHHAHLLHKNNWKFLMTEKSNELANERKLETDKVYAFYCWYIGRDNAAWRIKKSDLYKIFIEWCKQNGRKDMSNSAFGKNILKEKGVTVARSSTAGYYVFEGLKNELSR